MTRRQYLAIRDTECLAQSGFVNNVWRHPYRRVGGGLTLPTSGNRDRPEPRNGNIHVRFWIDST
jgi:hypothetical protein